MDLRKALNYDFLLEIRCSKVLSIFTRNKIRTLAEFNLNDLEKIKNSREVLEYLVDNEIIKESKFLQQYAYEKELTELQYELVRLQHHIIENKKRLLIIFEGRDAAGKGGAIKRFIPNINPKKYRVVALSKPTEAEQKQWYFQRYIKELPKQGEIAFFDRSWYNRAVVEPVFGFCTEEQHEEFMNQVNRVEKLLVDDGVILIKFFLNISKEEQKKRLDKRMEDPLKQWKVGGLDKQAQEKWEIYSHYFDKKLRETSSKDAPWIEIKTDEKKEARLNCIKYVLSSVVGFDQSKELKLDHDIIIKHN